MKYNKDFRKWQQRFYNSKEWRELRNHYRELKGFRCEHCNKIIKTKSIVDHIQEITPSNKNDYNIILNIDNLQLLCIECHNKKTFKDNENNFNLNNRRDINLF